MTLAISTTKTAPRSAPILMPLTNIAAWSNPGFDLNETIRNLANEAAPMAAVNPNNMAFGPRYVDLKSVVSSAYLNSNINATGYTAWTLISIYEPIEDPRINQGAPQLISSCTATGGNWYGIGLGTYSTVSGSTPEERAFYSVRGSYSGQVGGAGAAVENFIQPGVTGISVMARRAVAFRGINGGLMRVDDRTEGRFNEQMDARTTISPAFAGAENFRLGSSGNGTTRYGRSRHFFGAIIPAYITDTQLDRVIGQAVRSLAADGVAVPLAG